MRCTRSRSANVRDGWLSRKACSIGSRREPTCPNLQVIDRAVFGDRYPYLVLRQLLEVSSFRSIFAVEPGCRDEDTVVGYAMTLVGEGGRAWLISLADSPAAERLRRTPSSRVSVSCCASTTNSISARTSSIRSFPISATDRPRSSIRRVVEADILNDLDTRSKTLLDRSALPGVESVRRGRSTVGSSAPAAAGADPAVARNQGSHLWIIHPALLRGRWASVS